MVWFWCFLKKIQFTFVRLFYFVVCDRKNINKTTENCTMLDFSHLFQLVVPSFVEFPFIPRSHNPNFSRKVPTDFHNRRCRRACRLVKNYTFMRYMIPFHFKKSDSIILYEEHVWLTAFCLYLKVFTRKQTLFSLEDVFAVLKNKGEWQKYSFAKV